MCIRDRVGVACDNRENFALDFGKSFLHYGWEKNVDRLYEQVDEITAEQIQASLLYTARLDNLRSILIVIEELTECDGHHLFDYVRLVDVLKLAVDFSHVWFNLIPVSYTHLDVYKRQHYPSPSRRSLGDEISKHPKTSTPAISDDRAGKDLERMV